MDLRRVTEIIIGLAQEAGAIAWKQFGHVQGSLKYDGSLVTDCDAACEAFLRERLQRYFPEHSIYGEEMSWQGAPENEWLWLLDPIDGTSNFIFGLPIWGVSIGLVHQGQPVAGTFYMPATQQTFWAWRGGGAYCNGRRLQIYHPEDMKRTDLVCVSSTVLERYEFSFPQKIRCYGSAAQALAAMAAGSFAAVIHDNWHLYDIAAGLLMCQEAGAVITDEYGQPFSSFAGIAPHEHVPMLVIAGPSIHAQILQGVRRQANA